MTNTLTTIGVSIMKTIIESDVTFTLHCEPEDVAIKAAQHAAKAIRKAKGNP